MFECSATPKYQIQRAWLQTTSLLAELVRLLLAELVRLLLAELVRLLAGERFEKP